MMNYKNLCWLPEERLSQALDSLQKAITLASNNSSQRRQKNVIDPFLSLLTAFAFNFKNPEDLNMIKNATAINMSIAVALGHFHQNILGSVPGWNNHDAGYDLESPSKKIIAEIKNKHNTMNSDNRREVVNKLATALRQKKGHWTGFLVIMIPKKPQRYKTRLDNHSDLYEIDGASFYDEVSGRKNALYDLFNVVCQHWGASKKMSKYYHQLLREALPPKV